MRLVDVPTRILDAVGVGVGFYTYVSLDLTQVFTFFRNTMAINSKARER